MRSVKNMGWVGHSWMSRAAVALVALLLCGGVAVGQDQLRVESAETAPGSPVSLRLLLTHSNTVQGFQTAVTYDNAVLTLDSIDTAGLDVEAALAPDSLEFFLTTVDPSVTPSEGWGAVAAIFDSSLPFNGQTLPAGVDQSIVNYHFTTANDPGLVGTCSTVRLRNGFGPAPGINNVITVSATSVAPLRIDGQVCFVDLPMFRRADSNQDGISNIADGIFLLLYLFAGGPAPLCLDAVDVNDDEMADLSDFIFSLGFQFTGGPPPAAPFLACGIDVTGPDLLGCLAFAECGTFNPPPTITAVLPNTGSVAGGDTVTVTGADFSFSSIVFFGGVEALSVLFENDGTLTVVTPPHAAGVVPVQVTNTGGAATLVGGFTYQ